MKVNIYIELWTLKLKCTQYGLCAQIPLKNVGQFYFSKSDGTDREHGLHLGSEGGGTQLWADVV